MASAGNKPCLDMRLGFRNQWVGFEGAPSYSFASLSGRISETNQSVHGVGGRIETDEAGPWGTTSFSLAYAYKLKMTNGGWLSSGLSVGVVQHRLNIGSLNFSYRVIDVPTNQIKYSLNNRKIREVYGDV